MSDVNVDNQGSTPGTEGRSLSRARRLALSQGGKSAVAQTQNAKPIVRGHVRPPAQARVESAARPANPSPVSVSPANSSPVKDASDTVNRSTEDCDCTHTAEANTLEAVCALVETDAQAMGASAASVRDLCRERRQTRSSLGKSAQEQRSKNGTARRNGQPSFRLP